ncbi:MAG: hypothetical protein ACYDBT_15320 [Desulfobulbaceae bacterium]
MSWKWLLCSVILLAAFQARPIQAASCLSGGCHQTIAASKYLHGPIAAEQMGNTGCITCHIPAGKACAPDRAGSFQPLADSVRMCQTCHSRGTGTQHTGQQVDCLKCHDPHGSERGPDLPRP